MSKIVKLEGIYKSFGEIVVFEDMDMEVEKGDFVFIMGESGIGKTTLLKLIYLEEKPDRGNVFIFSRRMEKFDDPEKIWVRRQIAVVFQDFKLIDYRTVFDNVYMPLGYLKVAKDIAYDRARKALEFVKLWERKDELPSKLSGGERQRVAIARAIAKMPKILIADEPTGNLDRKTSLEILDYFVKLHSLEGMTIIMATHDVELVKRYPSAKLYRIEGKKLQLEV